jgi:predicted polyphosphate/ATP-dependent NAD kinase
MGGSTEFEDVLKALSALGLTEPYDVYRRFSEGVKLGFVVNPIAGIGGKVGLKGSDGDALFKALSLGAKPVAPTRAVETLSLLKKLTGSIKLYTYPKQMGEYEASEAGFEPIVVGRLKEEKTTAQDTKRAIKEFSHIPVDLIVFVGGDGTARDVYEAVRENGVETPILGVPSGVKMHSAVFALNPQAAARIIARFAYEGLPVRLAEVMDVDEEAFREGRVSAKLYGYLPTPYEPNLLQPAKEATILVDEERLNQIEVARYVAELLEPDTVYILGPGSTTQALGDVLGVKKTQLGVDLLLKGKIIASDVNEQQILEAIKGRKAKIIVTPIGGQGFIFGRGNQQISPEVIRRVGLDNIIIVATRRKVEHTPTLRVDTGDAKLDEQLKKKVKVIVGYREEATLNIE